MTQVPPENVLAYASTPDGLRHIASTQRAILLCILVNILLYGGLMVGQSSLPQIVQWLIVVVMFGVNITATVFVFSLATKIYGTGVGIVLGILTLIPCIGLITLLVVNGKATALLKAQGVKVGLLGAKL